MGGGFWSVYWYNGQIIGSEMQRGLDIFELTASAAISQNEIDAAKSIHMDFLNVQDQPKLIWPATFALSRAYTDQLERWKGLALIRWRPFAAGSVGRRGDVGWRAARCAEQAGRPGHRILRRFDGSAARAVVGARPLKISQARRSESVNWLLIP